MEAFKGVSIIMNYTFNVIEILLKNVPQLPVTIGELYVTRGYSSPQIHIPFKFDEGLDKQFGVAPMYNSLEEEIIINSSMNKRFLDIYGVNRYPDVTGKKALVKTEYLIDDNDEKLLMLYSLEKHDDDNNLQRYKPKILNPDESVIEILFRNLPAFPAYVSYVPEPDIKPGSTDYQMYFTFHDNLGEHFSGQEYHIALNNLAINKFMTLLDVNSPEECLGKNISVYTYIDKKKHAMYICGLTGFDEYLKKSVKFSDFRRIR